MISVNLLSFPTVLTPNAFHLPWFYQVSSIWSTVKIVKCLTVKCIQFPAASSLSGLVLPLFLLSFLLIIIALYKLAIIMNIKCAKCLAVNIYKFVNTCMKSVEVILCASIAETEWRYTFIASDAWCCFGGYFELFQWQAEAWANEQHQL
jgi:hypothetical protein